MRMDIQTMRYELLDEYPGDGWKQKVRRMPDYQVFAIYKSIRKRKEKPVKANKPGFEQIKLDLGAFF